MTHLRTDDVVDLTCDLIDIPSVSGDEKAIADAIEEALRGASHLEVLRDGDAIVARTNLGRSQRVIIAGHIDTVPISGNVPHVREETDGVEKVRGRGAVDMLGGVAAALYAALKLNEPKHDVTWVFYDHEEVAAPLNGLGRVYRNHPDWIDGQFAILGEPTNAQIEGGCNGTVRVIATVPGVAAHSARAWRGDNAIHKVAPIIEKIAMFGNPVVNVDGLDFRESLSVTRIDGGIANNVIPDSVRLTVNYRFAPSMSPADAIAHIESYFDGVDALFEIDDESEGARPGADSVLAQEFIETARRVMAPEGEDLSVSAKVGWTDVARFSALGIPAINCGPGDPLQAHTQDEAVPVSQLRHYAKILIDYMGGGLVDQRRTKLESKDVATYRHYFKEKI